MKRTSLFAAAGFTASTLFAGISDTPNLDGFYEITDPINASDGVDGVVTLEASKEYLLTEVVYVSDVTLEIPAGTVIRGVEGQLDGNTLTQAPGTLVITRSGQINAVGTPAQPIIFTDEFDLDPKGDPSPAVEQDGSTLLTGLWGGVIILGNAPTNNDSSGGTSLLLPGEDFIEGLIEPTGTRETADLRGTYGGDAPHDSSGVMRYVSIRNGGFNLSDDNEINGLTMGGVGAGTVLEFIEVFAGQDDGFEWFGGTVNSKYLLSAYNNDDAFDYDQGFSGLGQFWAVVQLDNNKDGDKGGEFDGDDQPGAKPFAVPVIYNMTVIGTGTSGVGTGSSGTLGGGQIDYDANAGGSLFNSIIVEAGKGTSLDINGTSGDMVNAGLLNIRSNIWFGDVSSTTPETADDHDEGSSLAVLSDAANKNTFANPFIGGANYLTLANSSRVAQGGVYLKPLASGDVVSDLEPYIGSFFDAVNFKGAFDPASATWTSGWTVPSQLGYFAE